MGGGPSHHLLLEIRVQCSLSVLAVVTKADEIGAGETGRQKPWRDVFEGHAPERRLRLGYHAICPPQMKTALARSPLLNPGSRPCVFLTRLRPNRRVLRRSHVQLDLKLKHFSTTSVLPSCVCSSRCKVKIYFHTRLRLRVLVPDADVARQDPQAEDRGTAVNQFLPLSRR